MGKTVVKQSDVDKLFDALLNGGAYIDADQRVFEETFQEVFAIFDDTRSIAKQEQDESLEQLCAQITDKNKPELLV